jgi:hypothetical protein
MKCKFKLTDILFYLLLLNSYILFAQSNDTAKLFNINNLLIPLDHKGVLADVGVIFPDGELRYGGRFDDEYFLFSGGFYLTGKYPNGKIWANAVATASRDVHYIPGTVGSEADDPKNKIYTVSINDTLFGKSWQDWKNAVDLGAKFIDGNNDGIYTPIDLNNNNEYDENEDKPEIEGEVTYWCVYNDGMDSDLRSFTNVEPIGIEIKQTVFGYYKEKFNDLSNVMFIRYEIENKGEYEVLDSVFFGGWADPDNGEYTNDLVGSSIEQKSVYCYDNEIDPVYGNSPSFFVTYLSTPHVYLPGISFEDVNDNSIFDADIDIPLDTAYYNYDSELESKHFIGAAETDFSSVIHYVSSDARQGDPTDEFDANNYLRGRRKDGNPVDPCTWEYGQVFGDVDCASINPYFWYSGDPVLNNGWLCIINHDQRMLGNIGPFQLRKNDPVEILIAYIVGRGNTSLESVNVTKDIARRMHGYYQSNFTDVPVSVDDSETGNHLPVTFSLGQNYPNPFNPSTTIEYNIPSIAVGTGHDLSKKQSVQLVIYDILGRQVATLVNKQQKPGTYKVEWDASSVSRRIASGIYFYQLKTDKYHQTNKLILLK